MRKENLHKKTTYTLKCDDLVAADELYELLDASEVLPVGGHRYRFRTYRKLIDIAHVLWKQNRFKQSDGYKFKALRDDKDQFTLLVNKPTTLFKYYRREPTEPAPGVQAPEPTLSWHCLHNLPRDVPHQVLLRAVSYTHLTLPTILRV